MSTPAQRMVAEQLRPHGVTDERVLEAMASVPREEFLAPRMRRHAYEDRALAIEWGQTISQPLVVALMIQAASPQPDEAAFEVGTGSGYAAAVLSRLCRRVITIEREPALASHASETRRRLGFGKAEVARGGGRAGSRFRKSRGRRGRGRRRRPCSGGPAGRPGSAGARAGPRSGL